MAKIKNIKHLGFLDAPDCKTHSGYLAGQGYVRAGSRVPVVSTSSQLCTGNSKSAMGGVFTLQKWAMLVTRAFPWEWLISIGQDTTVASTGTHLSLAFMQDFGSTFVWLSASYVPDILCLGGWRELFLALPPSSHLRSFSFLPLFIFLGIWALLLSVLMNLGYASDHSPFLGVGRGVSFQHTP